MAPFLFRCPTTAMLVQDHSGPDEQGEDGRKVYRAINCLACGGLHLVNPLTGKLMSEEAEDPPRW